MLMLEHQFSVVKIQLNIFCRAVYESPNSIRGMYGLTDTRNCTHGSGKRPLCLMNFLYTYITINNDKWFYYLFKIAIWSILLQALSLILLFKPRKRILKFLSHYLTFQHFHCFLGFFVPFNQVYNNHDYIVHHMYSID